MCTALAVSIGIPVILFAGLLLTITVKYGYQYTYRVLVYNEATIKDYERVFSRTHSCKYTAGF